VRAPARASGDGSHPAGANPALAEHIPSRRVRRRPGYCKEPTVLNLVEGRRRRVLQTGVSRG